MEDIMTEEIKNTTNDRRHFLKNIALGSAAIGGAAMGLFGNSDPSTGLFGVQKANAADYARLKMAFIKYATDTVSSAWSKGIEDVLTPQQIVDYKLLDGQGKAEVQVSLM